MNPKDDCLACTIFEAIAIFVVLCIALLFFWHTAQAATVWTCMGSGACLPKAQPIKSTDMVSVSNTNVGSGATNDFTLNATLKAADPLDPMDLIGTCDNNSLSPDIALCKQGWTRRRDILVDVIAYVPPKYDCWPKSRDEIRIGKDTGAGVVLWYCDMPAEIKPQYFCGDPAKIPDGYLSMAIAAVVALFKPTRDCTHHEMATMASLHFAEGVKIKVTPSTSGSRPAYTRTAQNTQGPLAKDAGGKTLYVPANQTCGQRRLVDIDGKATHYHEVWIDGRSDIYAYCTVTGAVSK